MKLEVGMYVRTKYGISKIDEDRRINYGIINPVIDILKEEAIFKTSNNIIDLIEVGDYVNGYKLLYQDSHYSYFDTDTCDWIYIKKDEQIKSIVTKEQFESMSYKL